MRPDACTRTKTRPLAADAPWAAGLPPVQAAMQQLQRAVDRARELTAPCMVVTGCYGTRWAPSCPAPLCLAACTACMAVTGCSARSPPRRQSLHMHCPTVLRSVHSMHGPHGHTVHPPSLHGRSTPAGSAFSTCDLRAVRAHVSRLWPASQSAACVTCMLLETCPSVACMHTCPA